MEGKERLRDALEETMRRGRFKSLRELAEEADISHGTLSNIRNLKKVPSPDTLAKLSPLFQVDLDTLLVWAGHRPAPNGKDIPPAVRNFLLKTREGVTEDELEKALDVAWYVIEQDRRRRREEGLPEDDSEG
jgi:transcriptional regulator with XRE-family HTH domain